MEIKLTGFMLVATPGKNFRQGIERPRTGNRYEIMLIFSPNRQKERIFKILIQCLN
jgi:hypothetical protein